MSHPVLEFDCCECERHIIIFVGKLPEPRLCGVCLMIPGWHDVPELRALIDPGPNETHPLGRRS